MASIHYATILNSFVSTEGSNGFMTNYIYYSVLVAFTDGSRQVVEGQLNQISYLLPYVVTPQDELELLRADLKDLKQTVSSMRREISDMTDEKMRYVVESLYPIPDLNGLKEEDALREIESAGLRASFARSYPEGLPESGVVVAYQRSSSFFKTVEADLIYPVPAVNGMKKDDALALLNKNGFSVKTVYEYSEDYEDMAVLNCSRDNVYSMDVVLCVGRKIPAVIGQNKDDALRLLESAGLHPVARRVIVDNGETDKVLAVRMSDTGEDAVIVEFSSDNSSLPLNGMEEEQAIAFLEENGINYRVNSQYAPFPRNQVYEWEWQSSDDDTIVILRVSRGPEVMEAGVRNVKWDTMQGSSGDTYKAEVSYSQRVTELKIDLNYKLGAKAKHKILAAQIRADGGQEKDLVLLSGNVMDVSAPGVVKLSTQKLIQLPGRIAIVLRAQYGGLMPKEENIKIEMDLDW